MLTFALSRLPHPIVRFWLCLIVLFGLLSGFVSGLTAFAQQPSLGPGPVIYEPNAGFGTTLLRDASSFDVRGSVNAFLPNVGAIDHSSDGSLLFAGHRLSVGSFSVVDLLNQQTLGTIDFPFLGLSECDPNSVAVLPDNSKAYIACGVNGFVEIVNINPTTGELSRATPIFTGNPRSAQFVSGAVWVSNHQRTNLVRIDPINDTAQVIVNTSPFLMDEVAVDPLRPYAYISHFFNNRILIANTITGGISRTLSFAGEPIDLQLSPSGDQLYVTVDNGEGNGQDHIAVVEGLGEAEHVVATIPVGEGASYLSTNDEGTCLFAWDFSNGYRRLDVIDTATNQLSAQPIIAGGGPDGDFVSPGASPQAVYLEPNAEDLNRFRVPEAIGLAQVVVRRSCSAVGTVSVNYATQDPTNGETAALPGVDYTAVSGMLTFAPGEVLKTIEVPILNNDVYGQSSRSFELVLGGVEGAFLGNRFVDTVQIDDDDAIPSGTDLQLSLYGSPDPVDAGAELIYYVSVNNYPTDNSDLVAQSVIVTAQLPTGVAFASVELENNPGGGGGDFFSNAARASAALESDPPTAGQCATPVVGESGSVICNVGDLNSAYQGAYAQITIRVNVLASAANSTLASSAAVTASTFDPFLANNTANATTTVNPAIVNQPPLAVDDSATTPQGSPVTIDPLVNDSDADVDILTLVQVSSPTNGQSAINGSSVIYTPNPGFSGGDSFTYTISDGKGGEATATVSVTVTPVAAETLITIVLDSRPDANQNVRFTGSAPLGRFILDDSTPQDTDRYTSSRTFSVQPGVYVITETVPTNRLLASITCNGNTSADLVNGTATIAIANGETVTCTFVNERPVTIRTRAYEDRNLNGRRNGNDPLLTGWQMAVYRDSSSAIVTSGLTEGNPPTATFSGLLAGTYTVCETLPSGWANSDPGTLTAPYGQPCRSVTLAPAEAVTLLFGNYQQAVSNVLKSPPAVDDAEPSMSVQAESFVDEESTQADELWLAQDPAIRAWIYLPAVSR